MKKWLPVAILATLSLVLLAGCTVTPAGSTPAASATPAPTPEPAVSEAVGTDNPLLLADFKTADILNGFQTEKVGELGYIEITKSEMEAVTGEQLTEFCKIRVDGSGLNWVGIVFEDGTGLHINDTIWAFVIDYGTIDIGTATFSDKIGAVVPEEWSADGSAPVSYRYISFEGLDEVQEAVERVVSEGYDGFFSCSVDISDDETGFSVSAIVDDLDGIEPVEALINSLDDPRIVEISITAIKDGKFLGSN